MDFILPGQRSYGLAICLTVSVLEALPCHGEARPYQKTAAQRRHSRTGLAEETERLAGVESARPRSGFTPQTSAGIRLPVNYLRGRAIKRQLRARVDMRRGWFLDHDRYGSVAARRQAHHHHDPVGSLLLGAGQKGIEACKGPTIVRFSLATSLLCLRHRAGPLRSWRRLAAG